MRSAGPGFLVLYRWRVREGAEESFPEAWSRLSELLLSERALASQQLAIDRQKGHIALYKAALVIGGLLVAGLVYIFLRVARPYW